MRLSELAKLKNISRERLRRQLEQFAGVLYKLNPSKLNSPIMVNMRLLQIHNVNSVQHTELLERLEKVEHEQRLIKDALLQLSEQTI